MLLHAIERMLGKSASEVDDAELRTAVNSLKRAPDDDLVILEGDRIDDDEDRLRDEVHRLKRTADVEVVRTIRATHRQAELGLAAMYAPIAPSYLDHARRLASS